MTDQPPGDIVIVQRMGGGAVDERCVMGRCPKSLSPYGGLRRAAGLTCPFRGDGAATMPRSGKRHANTIEDRSLGDIDRPAGQILETGVQDEVDAMLRVLR